MGRLAAWVSRTFGARPADAGPDAMEVVFEGPPYACQIAGLRLQQEGFLVEPDPTPKYVGFGAATPYRNFATRDDIGTTLTVSVLASEAEAARAVLAAVEPI